MKANKKLYPFNTRGSLYPFNVRGSIHRSKPTSTKKHTNNKRVVFFFFFFYFTLSYQGELELFFLTILLNRILYRVPIA